MIPEGIEELSNGEWVVANDTHLGLWAKQHKSIISDPHLMQFLKPFLLSVGVIYDLGANIGDHTRFYLNLGKKVIAVEPNPLAFKCLEHNCPEAICLNLAASDSESVLRFVTLENVGASRIHPDGEIEVMGGRLDDLDLPNPGFVKLDVEGHELFALRGMRETLKDAMPIVFIEINRGALELNDTTPEDVKQFFVDLGYTQFQMYPASAKWEDPQFDLLIQP